MTPNARTKDYLEKQGHMVAIVERHSPFPKPFGKKHDMFGVFDLFMLKAGGESWGVQATSTTNLSSRVGKIRESKEAARWLELGGKILVIGWAKRGERGKRKVWTPREVVYTG